MTDEQEDWARIFKVDNKQVLFTIRYDSDENQELVIITYLNDDMSAWSDLKLSFDEEKDAIKFFKKVATQKGAETALKGDIRELIGIK